jgi:hypothetical protein
VPAGLVTELVLINTDTGQSRGSAMGNLYITKISLVTSFSQGY